MNCTQRGEAFALYLLEGKCLGEKAVRYGLTRCLVSRRILQGESAALFILSGQI